MTEPKPTYRTRRRAGRVDADSEPERALETQLIQAGVTGWKRELMFHSTRRWRFDFAFVDYRLAVEIEGGTWARGRHTRGGGFAADCVKYNEALLLGWKVFRFTSGQVTDGTALRYIQAALDEPW